MNDSNVYKAKVVIKIHKFNKIKVCVVHWYRQHVAGVQASHLPKKIFVQYIAVSANLIGGWLLSAVGSPKQSESRWAPSEGSGEEQSDTDPLAGRALTQHFADGSSSTGQQQLFTIRDLGQAMLWEGLWLLTHWGPLLFGRWSPVEHSGNSRTDWQRANLCPS